MQIFSALFFFLVSVDQSQSQPHFGPFIYVLGFITWLESFIFSCDVSML